MNTEIQQRKFVSTCKTRRIVQRKTMLCTVQYVVIPPENHRKGKRNPNCRLQVAVAPQIKVTAYCRVDFKQNATRNFCRASVFSSLEVQPYGWVLFFLFFIIINVSSI